MALLLEVLIRLYPNRLQRERLEQTLKGIATVEVLSE
jgi:hypothetical protein